MGAREARGRAGIGDTSPPGMVLLCLVAASLGIWPPATAFGRPRPAELHPTAPVACEVRVRRLGPQPHESVRQYDAGGRLLYGTTRLTYDGRAAERLTWEGDRLVLVESTEEHPARRGNCDVVGGCDEPPTRVYVRAELRYREGRLVRVVEKQERRVEEASGGWRVADRRSATSRLEYDAGHLVAIHLSSRPPSGRGPIRFRYRDGRLVSRVFEEGRLRWEQTFGWQGGRLVSVEGRPVCHALTHDDAGRVTRLETRSCPDGGPGADRTEWSYGPGGRVAARALTRAAGAPGARPTRDVYRYDDQGRLLEILRDGRPYEAYAYEGSCAAVTMAPPAPEALELTQGTFCHLSHGRLIRTCV